MERFRTLGLDFMVLYNAFVLSWGLTITQNSIHTISDLDRSRLSDTDPEYRIDASLMKMPSKLFWRQSVPFRDTLINHPCHDLILKHAVLMFIQQSQTPQINNTGNVYRNIGNGFKNHITVIEKNYIAIHIDIELLSSPKRCHFLLAIILIKII